MEIIEFLFWALVVCVITYVFTVGWFLALAKAAELQNEGVEFDQWAVKYPAYVFLSVGAMTDIVFNAIFGTVIFRELPREFFFTNRVKRHVKTGHPKAKEWAERINKIFPNHI